MTSDDRVFISLRSDFFYKVGQVFLYLVDDLTDCRLTAVGECLFNDSADSYVK